MSTAGGLKQLQGAATLSLKLAERKMESLFLLLQNGFFIEAFVGCTIKDFFLKQLGLSPDYAEVRIQGIFLDGKPADDIDTAVIRDGARLTVSGTMPGLVGIALRRGPLAVFRHSITHRETGDYDYKGKGVIKLKLLNLLMKEMGPGLLRKGIYMDASELTDYLGKLPADFWQECTITMDDREVSAGLFIDGSLQFKTELVKFSAASFN